MKTFKRVGIIFLIIVAALAAAIWFTIYYVSVRALPDYDASLKLQGLTAEVTILRDGNAMPHIYASNEHDLYFATGFVMAQDRLWQMDLLRRVTMGRLSEIFGADMVKTDHLLRALRMSEKSQMVLERTEDSIRRCLDAFADGVNAFVARQGSSLPPEFTILSYEPEPWEAYHTVNLIGYMAWDLSGSWQNEVMLHQLQSKLPDSLWRQLFPDMNAQTSTVHTARNGGAQPFALLEGNEALQTLGLEIFHGSNNWAVSSRKSIDGNALMANDMHLAFGAPGIWYQMHQVIEGQLNVTGVALPGAPCVISGHNDSIGWGMTNLYVDEMDFFIEKVDDSHPDQYFYQGAWLPMKVVNEKIAVKGGDTIERVNRFTHHGPVVSGFKGIENEVLTMRWTGNDYSNELRTVYLLNHADNWTDFRDALTTFQAVSQNVVYADAKGNIGLQTAGGVPVRREGNGIQPVPGDTDRFEWVGQLPFDSLPFTFNPEEGYVSSANNKTTDSAYPYYIGYWFDNSSRIDRIRQMIESKAALGSGDFMMMHGDQISLFVQKYTPGLLQVLDQEKTLSYNEQKAAKLLQEWDGHLSSSGSQAAIFESFFLHFMHAAMADELGADSYANFTGGLMRHIFDYFWMHPGSNWLDDTQTKEKETFNQIVLKAFRQAVAELETKMGTDPALWEWGKLHQLTLRHPLGKVSALDKLFDFNRGPYAVGGSFHTVNPMAYNFHKPYEVVHGASQRHIFNLGNPEDSYMVVPTGISGIPASDYYCSQTTDFLNVTYSKDLFTRQAVESGEKYRTVLLPE